MKIKKEILPLESLSSVGVLGTFISGMGTTNSNQSVIWRRLGKKPNTHRQVCSPGMVPVKCELSKVSNKGTGFFPLMLALKTDEDLSIFLLIHQESSSKSSCFYEKKANIDDLLMICKICSSCYTYELCQMWRVLVFERIIRVLFYYFQPKQNSFTYRSLLFHIVIKKQGLIYSCARLQGVDWLVGFFGFGFFSPSDGLVPVGSPRSYFVFALHIFQLCVCN